MNRWGALVLAVAAGAFSAFLAAGERRAGEIAVIESSPPGASVFVAGAFVGTTPLRVEMGAGRRALRLEREGHGPLEASVSAGERCSFRLSRIRYARLRVDSEPSGADVHLDGAFRGRTPAAIDAVAPGRHVLMVDKANREIWKAEVSLAPGEDKEIRVELRDRVLDFLEAVVRSAPDDVLAWCDYAHYLFLQDDYEGAVEAYRNGLAAAYKPGSTKEARKRIDREIKKHYRWNNRNMKEFQEAMERVRGEMSSHYPDNPVMLVERARVLRQEGRREEALELMEKAAAKWRDPDTWIEAGRLSLQLGRCEDGLRAFGRAIAAAPADHTARQRVASSCRIYSTKLKDEAEQREAFEFAESALLEGVERARARDARATLLQELGELYRYQKRADDAVEQMERAVGLSEGNEAAKRALRLAGYLRSLGKREPARKYYRLVAERATDAAMRRAAEKELDRLRE